MQTRCWITSSKSSIIALIYNLLDNYDKNLQYNTQKRHFGLYTLHLYVFIGRI